MTGENPFDNLKITMVWNLFEIGGGLHDGIGCPDFKNVDILIAKDEAKSSLKVSFTKLWRRISLFVSHKW